MSVSEKVEELLKDEIESKGYQLVDCEYVKEGKEWYLRFFIDHTEGISLDDCSLVSRFIEEIIDPVENLIPNQYILEVSSIGAERPLKKDEDFKENINKYVMAHLYKKLDGKKEIIGFLREFGKDYIEIDVLGTRVRIDRSNISKIHLLIEF